MVFSFGKETKGTVKRSELRRKWFNYQEYKLCVHLSSQAVHEEGYTDLGRVVLQRAPPTIGSMHCLRLWA
uniref:Uncharacterized protein n=1 Tax=Anguilla anguilla TaxID=7936 RepID=A0A0E9WDA0_ANGAN